MIERSKYKIFLILAVIVMTFGFAFVRTVPTDVRAQSPTTGPCDYSFEAVGGNPSFPYELNINCGAQSSLTNSTIGTYSYNGVQVPVNDLVQSKFCSQFLWNKLFTNVIRTADFTCYSGSGGGSTDIDSGLRVNEGTPSSPLIVPISATPNMTDSPLRLAKNGTILGIALVNPSDISASKTLIRVSPSSILALKKYSTSGSATTTMDIADLPDQTVMTSAAQNGSKTDYSGTITIVNPTKDEITLTRTSFSPLGSETAPSSILLHAHFASPTTGFGYLSLPGYPSTPSSSPYGGTGSATYNIVKNGVTVGSVTYSWTYPI